MVHGTAEAQSRFTAEGPPGLGWKVSRARAEVYALYEHYGYGIADIDVLFIAGFGSSMVFGTFVGSACDKAGRRNGCVGYAIIYSLSCVTKHSPDYWVLMFGRLLGGIATSLLFSAFESWMVTEHKRQNFSDAALGQTFSRATLLNGVVAVSSGFVGQWARDINGPVAPFDTAVSAHRHRHTHQLPRRGRPADRSPSELPACS